MAPTVLVTGVAGFIGARTAEMLLSDGFTVVGVDNMNDCYDSSLKKYRLLRLMGREGFTFRKMDIEDAGAVSELFQSSTIDVVINLAARTGVRASIEDPRGYMMTNGLGTLNLLEEMRRTGVKKLVLASTSSLYAGQVMPFSEDLPVNTPISPYAASKKAAEVMAYTYHSLFGIDVTVLRYFTVYGPAGRPDMSIFKFIKWIDEGETVEVFGDGTQSRDFTYVDDAARGTILAIANVGFEIVNLGGGGNPKTLNTLISELERLLGKRAVVKYKPWQKTDMKETWADITKARRLLGWVPQVPFEAGLEATVKWHQAHREWLKDIALT